MTRRPSLILVLAVLAFAPWAMADAPKPEAPAADSMTQHKITLGGHAMAYTAAATTTLLRNEKNEPTARVFTVAYTANGADPARRPVSFFFNGGPGAGSAFLHLGAAGPEVLDFPAGHETDGAHAALHDNPDSWLGFTDMVFIDPVGTGYSRAVKPEDAPRLFWGVRQDGAALAKVIADWLVKNGRTRSPKYLVGESYGGIRSTKVATSLAHDQAVLLDGIVMVSPLIEGQYFFTDDPLTHALVLPTLAAAAAARAGHFTPAVADAAYRYALGDYLATIVGKPQAGTAADAFYGHLAELTGVPLWAVRKERGLIAPEAHDVRSQGGKLASLYDFTLTVDDPFPEGEDNEDSPDPLLEGYGRAYGIAFAGYAADTLGYKTTETYRLLDDEVNRHWDWHEHGGGPGPASGVDDLRRLLALNPALRVLIAHGYFDTVCPFATTRFLVEHFPVGSERVTLKNYLGGHMLYTRPASRAALAADVRQMMQ